MAFEKMGSFTFNHADQADELNLPADEAKAKFDSRASELKTAINKVVDLLNATTDGASGADNVGAAAISGVTGTTVQAQMKSMKGLVDGKAASGHNHDSSYAASSHNHDSSYAASNHNHDSSYAPIDLAGTDRTIETVKGNADDLKTHLADKASHINGNAACRICNSVNQSIANNTSTLIAFNTEIFDNDTMHDAVTNNTRLTCKSAGKYLVIAQVGFEVNTTGYRGLDILKNGMLVGRIICAPAPTIESVYCATTIIELAVNDYVELSVFQTSGGALNVRADGTMLMAIKVG